MTTQEALQRVEKAVKVINDEIGPHTLTDPLTDYSRATPTIYTDSKIAAPVYVTFKEIEGSIENILKRRLITAHLNMRRLIDDTLKRLGHDV